MFVSPWSAWRPVAGIGPLTAPVLAEILDGGQTFRWHRETAPSALRSHGEARSAVIWQGIWSGCVARLRLNAAGLLEWSAPKELSTQVASALPAYLSGAHDFRALADTLPWRSDAHLARCLSAFPGLTIPRQPFGETLLCFLCSATKQIVQIKQMVALLAERHGEPICRARSLTTPIHRLPTWSELAEIPEPDLRACLLGFRARYIKASAIFLASRPGWLEAAEHLPYSEAKARLLELPGVGEKVADCVLLFGAGKLEAFPVDTWILKAMARHYHLDGWSPAQVAHFGRTHFGPNAGLAQQFLFAYERAQSRL
jgi:N-glycosylase/DNA lyase